MLDAGAGEGQYARHFARQRYCGVDLAVGDAAWDYSRLDAVADLTALPFRDAALSTPRCTSSPSSTCASRARALAEMARWLAPGAPLLVAAPHEWEVHQAPHDYFRYTRYGLAYLLEKAGLEVREMRAAGGYFRLLARRLLNGLQFFSGGCALAGLRSRRDTAGAAGADPAVSGFSGPGPEFHAGVHVHGEKAFSETRDAGRTQSCERNGLNAERNTWTEPS